MNDEKEDLMNKRIMKEPVVIIMQISILILASMLLGLHFHSIQIGISVFLLGIFIWECCADR